MQKTLLYKSLKEKGDSLEIAVGFDKPYKRREAKKDGSGRRWIRLNILPVLWVASDDNERGYYEDNVCQTTVHFAWLFFWIYVETFRKVKGSSRGGAKE